MFEGDIKEGELEIGQVSAQIKHIESVNQIMQDLIKGYKKARTDLNQFDF